MKEKRLARSLFVLFLAYIGLQEVAKEKLGDFVFPAITFPTFAWQIPVRNGRAHVVHGEIDVVLADGRRERITQKQFFGGMPVNQYHTTLTSFFRLPPNLRGTGDEIPRVNLAEVAAQLPHPRSWWLFTLFPGFAAGLLCCVVVSLLTKPDPDAVAELESVHEAVGPVF